MDILTQKICKELNWFIGKNVEFTSIMTDDNDMERYYKGVLQVDHTMSLIDLEIKQVDCHGMTIHIELLEKYEVKCHYINGFVQKTLIIFLTDGSAIYFVYHEEDNYLTELLDFELSDAYVRYLLHLPISFDKI